MCKDWLSEVRKRACTCNICWLLWWTYSQQGCFKANLKHEVMELSSWNLDMGRDAHHRLSEHSSIHHFSTSGSQIVVPWPEHHLGACNTEHLGTHPRSESERGGGPVICSVTRFSDDFDVCYLKKIAPHHCRAGLVSSMNVGKKSRASDRYRNKMSNCTHATSVLGRRNSYYILGFLKHT